MNDATPQRKFLDQLRDILRAKHYSYSTEQTYVGWVRRYILFHNKRYHQDWILALRFLYKPVAFC